MEHKDKLAYQQKIDQAKKEARTAVKIIVLGAVIMLVFLLVFPPLGLIGGIGLLIYGFNRYSGAARKMKEGVGSDIIRDIMDTIFDSYHFYPGMRIRDEVIDSVDFPYMDSYDEIEGNDYVKGVYQGLNFEMSDICLTRIEEYTDKDGDQKEEYITVFDGLWFICDFNKQLNSTITVSPRPVLGFARGIQMESARFNKRFYVEAGNEHDAFYVLTPHFMEKILQTREHFDCKMYLCFKQDGHVHILIDKGNALEIKSVMTDVDALVQQFTAELHQITDLVDEMKLTEAYR